MAESLYVCHFSNGHIKVGRSVDPLARVAAHAERVSCLGVLLAEHFIAECVGPCVPAEAALIARCAEAAPRRNLDEWFEGLDYAEVCRWAVDAAQMKLDYPQTNSRWRLMLAHLKRAGMTQMQIAEHCGCDQSTISALSNGRAEEPRHSLGERLIALHGLRCAEAT
jgi:hypothetical protein